MQTECPSWALRYEIQRRQHPVQEADVPRQPRGLRRRVWRHSECVRTREETIDLGINRPWIHKCCRACWTKARRSRTSCSLILTGPKEIARTPAFLAVRSTGCDLSAPVWREPASLAVAFYDVGYHTPPFTTRHSKIVCSWIARAKRRAALLRSATCATAVF